MSKRGYTHNYKERKYMTPFTAGGSPSVDRSDQLHIDMGKQEALPAYANDNSPETEKWKKLYYQKIPRLPWEDYERNLDENFGEAGSMEEWLEFMKYLNSAENIEKGRVVFGDDLPYKDDDVEARRKWGERSTRRVNNSSHSDEMSPDFEWDENTQAYQPFEMRQGAIKPRGKKKYSTRKFSEWLSDKAMGKIQPIGPKKWGDRQAILLKSDGREISNTPVRNNEAAFKNLGTDQQALVLKILAAQEAKEARAANAVAKAAELKAKLKSEDDKVSALLDKGQSIFRGPGRMQEVD